MHYFVFVFLFVIFGVAAQTPGAAPPMSRADVETVYAELAQTHDGFVYTVHMAGFSSEEQARKIWAELQQPRMRAVRLNQFFKNVTTRTAYLFTFDPPVREKLVTLFNGQRAGPIRTARAWVIVELVGTRPADLPPITAVESGIPGLVAAGALPSAEQLRKDPQLRKRAAANAVNTLDDLRRAPADLDLNQLLSSGYTLLTRALLSRTNDLAEELLKRGAAAGLCAHNFCPLNIAVFHGEAALANRLIAAGAQVNAQAGGETALMVAAGTAQRPMVELLAAKGGDLIAASSIPPGRTALDAAERGKNAEFAAWLRGLMVAKAKESGQYSWEGWIEQDGKRHALDGKVVALRREPFRIIVRMRPDAVLYVSASPDRRLVEDFNAAARKSNLFFGGTIAFEGNEGKDVSLVVHRPEKAGEPWGGSQAWWHREKETRFNSVADTPQGREYVREVRDLTVFGADGKRDDLPIGSFKGAALYLALGTRLRVSSMYDEVMGGKTIQLQFAR